MCSDGTWAAAVAAESGEYNESVAEARITTSSLTLPATVGTLPSAVPPAQRHHEPPPALLRSRRVLWCLLATVLLYASSLGRALRDSPVFRLVVRGV